MNIAVLVSGGGTNLQAIIDQIGNQSIQNICITKVIADRECFGLERAKNNGIEAIKLKRKNICETILPHLKEVDFIVLAGFLSILTEDFCTQWENKIINLHPSLLPKFGGVGMYGNNVHKAVLASQEKESGCTVHFVTPGVDKGQILFQSSVERVSEDTVETLASKIHKKEHLALPLAVKYISKLDQLGLKNIPLSDKRVAMEFQRMGFTHLENAITYIKNVPYGRNSSYDPMLILTEEKGNCTTKHMLIKMLLDEHNIASDLVIGIVEMSMDNTPKVADVLDHVKYKAIPNAQLFIEIKEEVLDFTSSESFQQRKELRYQTKTHLSELPELKTEILKSYIEQWIIHNGLDFYVEDVLEIRENCMKALTK